MQSHATTTDSAARRHRPKTFTVFAAAFTAGMALAYGVNRVIDVHVVRVDPQVECESILVARESMPQGSPVTVLDVKLKPWPKAMLPTAALRADASLEGVVLRYPIRKDQPLLSSQLVRDTGAPPTNGVVGLPPTARPADAAPSTVTQPVVPPAVPVVTERFIPATPADPPPAAAAVAEGPASDTATASTTAAPSAPATPLVAVVPQTAVEGPVLATDPDIDVMPEVVPDPPVMAEPPAVARVMDFGDQPALDAEAAIAAVETALPSGGADACVSPDVPDPMASVESTATMEPPPPSQHTVATEPTVPASAGDWRPAAAAGDPLPLAAPVPALPSTDIEGPLADVGRTVRGGEQARNPTADASVLDRTTEGLPPTPEQRTPVQHLVIPERIALAADSSFTQPVPPASGAPAAVGTTPTTARTGAAATPAATQPNTRRPAATQPAARKPAVKTSRQPAQKPPGITPRFWNSWVPPLGGGSRQR